ncbi:MAG: branched-chain amino acid ABC transporter permease [Mobilicoccus sp.]|nr:branched-chain amino acid ABC transporter permease [Mobilicoccus sp.]
MTRLDTFRHEHPGTMRVLLGVVLFAVMIPVIDLLPAFRQGQVAQVAYTAIAAGGLTYLVGLSGQLSLGHGAFMAVGAYTTALMLGAGINLWLTLVAAVLVTMAVGAVVGVAAARLQGPYIAGATLALSVAIPGLALHFSGIFGGEQGLRVPGQPIPQLLDDALFLITGTEVGRNRWLATLCVFFLIVTFVLLKNLAHSRVGRRWMAVRDDPVAAQLAGINLGRARVECFIVSTACAGLAGALMAIVIRIAAPSGFHLVLSLTLLSAVVLGGLGSLLGAFLGSALLVLLPQLTTNVGSAMGLSDLQAAEGAQLAVGVATVLVILFAPAGLVGTIRQKFRDRPTPTSPQTPAEVAAPEPARP